MSPGLIKTRRWGLKVLVKRIWVAFEELGARSTPLGTIGGAEEIARAVVFLGYEATLSTGSEVVVDGGLVSMEKAGH